MMEPPPPTPPLLSDSDSLSGSSPTTPNRFCTPEPLDFSVLRARLASAAASTTAITTTASITFTGANGNVHSDQASRLNVSRDGQATAPVTATATTNTTALGLEMDSLTVRPVLAFQDQDPHRSSVFPSVVAGRGPSGGSDSASFNDMGLAAAATGSRPSSSSSNQGTYSYNSNQQPQQQGQQQQDQQHPQQCSGTVAVIINQPKSRKRKCQSPLQSSISLVQTVPDMPVGGGYASTGGQMALPGQDGRHHHCHHHSASTSYNHLPTHTLDSGTSLFHPPAHNAYRAGIGAWDRQAQHPPSLPLGCISSPCSCMSVTTDNSAVVNGNIVACPSATATTATAAVVAAPNFDHHQQNGCSAKCCLNCLIRTSDGYVRGASPFFSIPFTP
jgi:hypothetical protein